jgi:hypothetical protein
LQDGEVGVTVTGTVKDGKAKVEEVVVREGATTTKYDSVDKVPEQHRDKVKRLVEMAEQGSGRLRLDLPNLKLEVPNLRRN